MTYAHNINASARARRRLAGLSMAIALGSTGCTEMVLETETDMAEAMGGERPETAKGSAGVELSLVGPPDVTFTTIRPVDGDDFVYERLAPRTAIAALDAQLTMDVVIQNHEGSTLNVDQVVLSYGGVLPSVILEGGLQKKCEGEGVVDLVDDRAIAPDEACRIMLTPDQKLPIPAPNQITIEVYFVGYTEPVWLTKGLKAHENAPSEGSYRFPAKAEDLPGGYYWSGQSSGAGSHHRATPSQFYAYDMGLVRWDGGSHVWTNLKPGTSGDNNSDYLVWGQPVYAMADGVVVDFENDEDDNLPGEKTSSANFFDIQHGDELGQYYHLKEGSLNPALLSAGATVTAGQYLGEVGNSGNSDFPHFHVQVVKGGVGMPLLFHEAFLIDRSAGVLGDPPDFNAAWTAVNDQGLPWEKNILWPSPFRRVDDAASNAISKTAIAHASANRAVTASRTAAGNLELVSWEINSSGFVVEKDEELAGPASEIAIAQPGLTTDVVTAFRNSGGDLELIFWDITGLGSITKGDEKDAGPVSKVAVSRVPSGIGVVTAYRDGGGDLGLIAWEVAGGILTRKGEAVTNDAITDVVITTITDPFDGVVTASRSSAGNLVLSTWEVTAAKNLIFRDEWEAGSISDLAAATVRVAFNKELVITGVRNGSGDFELIAWEISSTGQITKRGEAAGGAISDVAVAADGTSQIVSAMRDSGGDLKLIAYEVTTNGDFVREGEAAAGAVSSVALTGSFTSGSKKFAVPAMRDSGGDLRLISWQTNLTP